MMTSSYHRLCLPMDASWRAVVRAANLRFERKYRRVRSLRAARKAYYRRMLDEHRRHQHLADTYRL